MPRTLPPTAAPVEDQLKLLWSDPERCSDACIRALDEMLGHDVERLANATGISRRELNKQRERREDKFGRHWLHRLVTLSHRAAQSFGADRTRAAAHLFARACGHELASSVPEAAAGHEKESDIALLARTMREFSEASAQYAAAAENGISPEEARALLPEVDQALDQLQAIRNRLQSSVDGLRPALKVAGALTYGHKA